jgi:hypothetical protein
LPRSLTTPSSSASSSDFRSLISPSKIACPFLPKKEFRSTPPLDYRASDVSAYLLRGFRSLVPFVQLVNSVPTPSLSFNECAADFTATEQVIGIQLETTIDLTDFVID